jgi:hypothetical protein
MLKNLAPGTVLLIGALSLSVGWVTGRSSSSPNQGSGAVRQPSRPYPLGSPPNAAPFTRKLRERLDTQPARVPAEGRNPFVFSAPRPSAPRSMGRPVDRAPMPAPPSSPPPPEPFTPPAPQIRLSGIAASQEGGVAVLTAIISDSGTLVFVKAGDKLPSGATVIKVDETGVVLMDAAGITQTIRLP